MYESGHNSSGQDLRQALLALEEAVALQRLRLQACRPGDDALQAALGGCVALMEQEANRLRALLPRG